MLRSNWEVVVFRLMRPYVGEKDRDFSLSDVTKEWWKLDKGILALLKLRGHKNKLKAPEAEIRGTMQRMRDKKWLVFLDRGTYRLTDEGYRILLTLNSPEENHLTE